MDAPTLETTFPQLKDVEIKNSRRVLFDVQGSVFGASVDALKQVPSLLASLSDPESKFRTKEADGTVFINRSPKHFAEILNIISNFQNSDTWKIPAQAQERNELLQEADFYALPPDLVEALKTKVVEKEDSFKKQIEDWKAQAAAHKKEVDNCTEVLGRELREKTDLSNLIAESGVHTLGCYVSISEISFSLRVSKDFTRIMWSNNRSLEKVNATPYNYGKPSFEMRPMGGQEANIVLWNNLKSYILCERKLDNGVGMRIDLCSMGNGELLVILEGWPRHDGSSHFPPPSSSKPQPEERFTMHSTLGKLANTFQRIVCRFQPDPK